MFFFKGEEKVEIISFLFYVLGCFGMKISGCYSLGFKTLSGQNMGKGNIVVT